jgi:chromate transporter
MKPAVVAIVAFAAWRIGSACCAMPARGHRVLAFVASGGVRVAVSADRHRGRAARNRRRRASSPRSFQAVAPATPEDRRVIDDTRSRRSTRLSWGRLAWVLAVGRGAVARGMALLVRSKVATDAVAHGGVFSKAALVTFGGAYAVLPYVNQAAVEQYGWLTARR